MGLDLSGFGAAFDFVGKVVDKIFPDKTEAEKIKLAMFQAQQQGLMAELQNQFNLMLQQAAINIEEAKNGSVFVSGWRQFVGWVCGSALAYNYIAQPFIYWAVKCFYPGTPVPPSLDIGMLSTLLVGMLGIGAMRSFDKVKANTDNK